MYVSYPIYDFKSGLRLDKEPFILPADAFTIFQNVYLDKGSLIKREGVEDFLEIGEPILGIKALRDETNNVYNFVFTTQNIYCLDLFRNEIEQLTSNFLSAKEENYVIAEEWRYKLFCSNNINPPFYVERDGYGWLNIDFDEDGQNDVERCLLCLEFKERLLLFSTTEKGTACPQRIRWCKPNNPFDWSNDEYLDIPTSEIIISAQKIGDKVIIWCSDSVWVLLYTADYTMPFVVKCIAREIKTYSPVSGVVANNQVFNVTDTGIIVTDGLNIEKIDFNIYDFSLFQNVNKKHLTFGFHYRNYNQIWWSFASQGSEVKDKILYFDYFNKNWGIFDIPTNVISEAIVKENAKTWDEISETWDEIDYCWDKPSFTQENIVSLFGGYNGKIWKGLNNFNDLGGNIEFKLESVKMNPFLKEGKRVALGWVDFYIDCVDTTLQINFYLNESSSSILSETIDLSGEEEKKWIRVPCGIRGEHFKIEIVNTSDKKIKIHAIVYYLKPIRGSKR